MALGRLLAFIAVGCLLAYTADALGSCVSALQPCCPLVKYKVYSIDADVFCPTIDMVLESVFNSTLRNKTQACKEAYRDLYCVSAIPQCCSESQPVVFTACRSLCDTMFDKCNATSLDHPLRATSACNGTTFHDPPCNDGNGGPCP